MTWDASRRVFLRGASLAAAGIGLQPSTLLVRTAAAASPGTRVLVLVFLRGGADGLNLCVPHGDPEYYDLRGAIALPRPGQNGGVVDLDGHFGLHPALAPLKPLYAEGRLGLVQAVGCYDLTRSHFDAQDFMEAGTPGNKATRDGWLARTMAAVPGADVTESVSLTAQLTRALLGPEPVLVTQSLTAFDLRARNWRPEAEQLLRQMYAGSDPVDLMGRATFDAINVLLKTPEIAAPPSNGAVYPNAPVGNSLREAAQIIKSGLATRCIYVDVNGAFDTHAGQLAANAQDYASLGTALAAFDQDLGSRMDDVALMVTTEFGRTARVNGSAGTDHGSGNCAIALGGRVRGGRIHGTWPGLGKGQLFEDRDLAVTTDFRDLFAEMARAQLGVPSAGLFPGYTPGAGPGVFG